MIPQVSKAVKDYKLKDEHIWTLLRRLGVSVEYRSGFWEHYRSELEFLLVDARAAYKAALVRTHPDLFLGVDAKAQAQKQASDLGELYQEIVSRIKSQQNPQLVPKLNTNQGARVRKRPPTVSKPCTLCKQSFQSAASKGGTLCPRCRNPRFWLTHGICALSSCGKIFERNHRGRSKCKKFCNDKCRESYNFHKHNPIPVFPYRDCALPGCLKRFQPVKSWQTYCCTNHLKKAARHRRRERNNQQPTQQPVLCETNITIPTMSCCISPMLPTVACASMPKAVACTG